jgi:hypothetical protein
MNNFDIASLLENTSGNNPALIVIVVCGTIVFLARTGFVTIRVKAPGIRISASRTSSGEPQRTETQKGKGSQGKNKKGSQGKNKTKRKRNTTKSKPKLRKPKAIPPSDPLNPSETSSESNIP